MIILEPFTKADIRRLISWIDNEEELIQFAGSAFTFPLTEDQLEKYLEDNNRIVYKIIVASSLQVIGHCEIYLSETSAKLCRIFIGDKSFRGKGYGSAVINKLLKISFKQLDFNLAELNVYDWNIPAIRCYENAGFVVNPEKSKAITVNGKVWKSINMIIHKEAWIDRYQ